MAIASIVIPAHNEAATIGRCLRALLADGSLDKMEVIVSCNGCSDATAAIASSFKGVKVISTGAASKSAALNAADEVATVFPRIYLDADIELSPGAAEGLAQAFASGNVLAAAPTPVFQLKGRPWFVRAFYAAWKRSPYLLNAMVGSGIYAVNETGKQRLGKFPELFGDDLYVITSFTDDERLVLPDFYFVIRPPLRLRDLVAVRRRVYFGNTELISKMPNQVPTSGGAANSAIAVLTSSRSPMQVIEATIYFGVCAVAKFQARRMTRSGHPAKWDRDLSGRVSD